MSRRAEIRPDAQQLAAAWEWVLRLRDDDALHDDLIEWVSWYEADDRHKQAFAEMQALWRESGRLIEGPNGLSLAQLLGPAQPQSSSAQPAASLLERFSASGRRLAWAGAAMAAVLCALMAGVYWHEQRDEVIVAKSGPTVVREAVLPDGSKVELAARSAIALRYTQEERVLEMKGGEAHFSVARNPQRPFIVQVGTLRVRAVGTAFNIREAGDRVVVTVTDGAVEVYPQSSQGNTASSQPMTVKSGHQVIWTEGEATPVLAVVDVAQALAWKQGRLQYLNEPLAAVIADVNRYSSRKVTIGDAAAGEILFSGTVFTDATDAWLQALPNVFPIELQSNGDEQLVLLNHVAAE
jgi:transmembrane sensor